MNVRNFGILRGFVVLGIAFTGGAAAADSTDVAEFDTTDALDLDAENYELSENTFTGCCCCPVSLTATDFDVETSTQELDTEDCPNCHQELGASTVLQSDFSTEQTCTDPDDC